MDRTVLTLRAIFLFSTVALLLGFGHGSAEAKTSRYPTEFIMRPWTGDLDGMYERRFIRVLVTHSRTNYFLDGARERGFTHDILKAFEQWLNKNRKRGERSVAVVFVPVARDQLLPALAAGKGDIAAASLTVTESRLELVDFTNPFSSNVDEVIVTGPAAPPLKGGIESLSGQQIYVRRSSSFYESLQRLNERLAQQGLNPVCVTEADENLETEDLLEMVNAGLIPMTVSDDFKADFWARILPDIVVRHDLEISAGNHIAMAIRHDSPQLKGKLNEFIAYFKGHQDLGYLAFLYFKNRKYITNAQASEDMKRFEAAIQYFKKYGSQYEMDYLMLAAMGYQESRLDQNARSHVGAIGVMQLMPTTASGPPVNIKDVYNIDNNIHAGTKYIKYIKTKHLSDQNVDGLNQMLMAFASYNAGPYRIKKARDLAEQMGLDRNVWFNNVEIATSRLAGQEPIRYVSNIFKYYVAYKLIMEQVDKKTEALTGFDEDDPGGCDLK
jgi:membrane-bound lytic murein transglycosylase MltF